MLRLRLGQAAICSGLRYWPTMRSLPIWEPSRAITFTGARSVSAAGTRERANQLAEVEVNCGSVLAAAY
jgi:hypothetical protein